MLMSETLALDPPCPPLSCSVLDLSIYWRSMRIHISDIYHTFCQAILCPLVYTGDLET